MIISLSYKSKQFFFVLIKLSIVLFAFYFIYNKLMNNPDLDFNDFMILLNKNDAFSLKNVSFLLFLTFFNWFLEILKWQKLVSSIKKISLKKALEQNLGAFTASLFTPNRIGEYGAKAVYFSSNDRKHIVLLNLLGNMAQMSVTVILGAIGLTLFIINYNIELNHHKLASLIAIVIVLIALIGSRIKKILLKVRVVYLQKVFRFIKELSVKTHIFNWGFSLLRYLIFSFQFYYLLVIFGFNISYGNAMVIISSMYLLTSVIPSILIFDVVVKGSVAVYLFSIIGISQFSILCIVMLMWMLNFVLPSIFGSFYVLNFNLPKNETV